MRYIHLIFLSVISWILTPVVCQAQGVTWPLPDSYFGIDVHEPVVTTGWQTMGFGALRLWDTQTDWRSLEPSRGTYNFTRMDGILAAAQKNKLKVLLTLGMTPVWASSRPTEACSFGFGCSAPPANIQDWHDYVQTVARRYKGQIECYELWNEVSFPGQLGGGSPYFFSGTPAQLVALAKSAYQVIKAEDPAACVLTPSFHPSGNMIVNVTSYFAAGGGQYADGVAFHFYFGDYPETVVRPMRSLRAVIDAAGFPKMFIWNTEIGIPFSQKELKVAAGNAPTLDSAMVLHTYLLNLSQGISRVYWYSWDNATFGMTIPTSFSPNGATPAFVTALQALRGATSVVCTSDLLLMTWQCTVQGPSGTHVYNWTQGVYASPPRAPDPHIVN